MVSKRSGNGHAGGGAAPLDVIKIEAERSRSMSASCRLGSFDSKSDCDRASNGKCGGVAYRSGCGVRMNVERI